MLDYRQPLYQLNEEAAHMLIMVLENKAFCKLKGKYFSLYNRESYGDIKAVPS